MHAQQQQQRDEDHRRSKAPSDHFSIPTSTPLVTCQFDQPSPSSSSSPSSWSRPYVSLVTLIHNSMIHLPVCSSDGAIGRGSHCLQLQYYHQLPMSQWQHASEWEVCLLTVSSDILHPQHPAGVLGVSQQCSRRHSHHGLQQQRYRQTSGASPSPPISYPPPLLPAHSCLSLPQAAGQFLMDACGVIVGSGSFRLSYPAWHMHRHEMRVLQPLKYDTDADVEANSHCSESVPSLHRTIFFPTSLMASPSSLRVRVYLHFPFPLSSSSVTPL
jgi:hypothetical protein